MAEFPITFGQKYGSIMFGADLHPILGISEAKDGYLIIEADTRDQAREKAFAILGETWAFDYENVERLDPDHLGWYPLGEIARINKDGDLIVHDPAEVRQRATDASARRIAGGFFMALDAGLED